MQWEYRQPLLLRPHIFTVCFALVGTHCVCFISVLVLHFQFPCKTLQIKLTHFLPQCLHENLAFLYIRSLLLAQKYSPFPEQFSIGHMLNKISEVDLLPMTPI